MPAPTRSRSRRDRRGPDYDERSRRAQEAQDAAYEAARLVRNRAAARRDAEWKSVAEANRRRAMTVALAPAALAVVITLLGMLLQPLLYAGGFLLLAYVIFARVIWLRAPGTMVAQFTAKSPADAVAAGEVSHLGAERFVDLSSELCAVLGLPLPQLRIISDTAPNAVTVGRRPEDTVFAVTSGLVDLLDRIELEAVIAHELSHVKRLDITSAAIGASVLGKSLGAIGGERATLWLEGRDREVRADLAAVSATHYPPGLISALERISASGGSRPASLPASLLERTARTWLIPLAPGGVGAGTSDRLDLLREL